MILLNYFKESDFLKWDMDAFAIVNGQLCSFTNEIVTLDSETNTFPCPELEEHIDELKRILLENHYDELILLGITEKQWFE